ncbi:MAG TPA: putative LPS assembly protein LptD, partial [Bacteroidales bacterium]|nr:putative LPS assembly protein LptD [Bacteroidales bacterium]
MAKDSVAVNGDTLVFKSDTLKADTVAAKRRPGNTIESQVLYSTGQTGYIRRDIVRKKVVLVKDAKVNYGEIEIKADSILIDMQANTLFAIGRPDTSGKIAGKPVFKEGTQEIAADNLLYNFKTKRAVARNIETKQDQGLLHSQITKLLEDGTSNIAKSTYSTCEADTPHFYINLPKAKIYPGKKIISGPGNLVLEGIPLPLFLPFGYFPIQTKKAASGILIPRIGQENLRGYSLTDGGYYFAISNYFDLALRGNVYSNGSWIANVQTNYNRLYRYSGNLNFSYAYNVAGHKGLPDYNAQYNYKLGWTYNQDQKASPGSRFSASVNMSSSAYDRNNSYQVQEHVTTQRQSSISYSKTWEGTPFNFSISANHSQDVRRKTVFLNLPKANFNMSRIFPFKSRNSTGSSKWYEEIQFSYTASLDNRINTYDSLLFTRQALRNSQYGFSHEIPLSLQIRPFRNFSISPALTYTGVVFGQKIARSWVRNTENVFGTVTDTTRGIFYGQALNPSISASFNPQIFGTYQFTNPDSRVQAIRHVIKPSIGFSYIPSLKGLSTPDMYRQVQVDTLGYWLGKVNPSGSRDQYSVYEGNIYSTPALSQRSGNISFNLVNLVEAKVFAKNDTTGKPKKIKIIDNFGISTSYNIFADKFKWAPVSMGARTTLANNINISANGSFTLYGMNDKGEMTETFALKENGKLMRLTNFGTSVDLSVSDLLSGKKDKNKSSATPNALTGGVQQGNQPNAGDISQPNQGAGLRDAYGYTKFDVPWTMNLSYSVNYVKNGLKSSVMQALSMSGSVSVTKKM